MGWRGFKFSLLLGIILLGCMEDEGSKKYTTIDVGVYIGSGVWDASVKATLSALRAQNFSIDTIDIAKIMQDKFYHCRVLLIPGGDPQVYSEALGTVGRDRIRRYVSNGYGFIGFGGGAALAGTDTGAFLGLGLLNTAARWPVSIIAPYPQWVMTSIILREPQHPVGLGFYPRFTALYRWGPDFPSPDASRTTILCEYVVSGTPAAVVSEYGAGSVVLFGFQPEFEEGSPRDSCEFGDDLSDPESEWQLIENAVKYCLSTFR